MKIFTYTLIGFNSIAFSAHLSRVGLNGLAIILLAIPFVLFYKNKISIQIVQVYMIIAGIEWIRTMVSFIIKRIELNQPWLRLAVILGFVSILAFVSVFLLKYISRFRKGSV